MNEAGHHASSSERPRTPAQEAGDIFRSHLHWGIRQLIIGAVVVLLLLFVISTAILLPVADSYGDESPETYAASALTSIVWAASYVFTALFLVKRAGGSLADLGFRSGIYIPHDIYDTLRRRMRGVVFFWIPRLPLAIVAGYLAAYFSVLVYNILVAIFGLDFLEPSQQLDETIFDSGIVVVLTGLAVVLVAPVTEEILFRGFLFGGLRRYLPLWPAALISGFIFSTAHGNLGLIVPFSLIGIVLAYTYERSGTIVAPIGVHLIFNSVSFLALLLLPDLRG